jgi:hypothetical protein
VHAQKEELYGVGDTRLLQVIRYVPGGPFGLQEPRDPPLPEPVHGKDVFQVAFGRGDAGVSRTVGAAEPGAAFLRSLAASVNSPLSPRTTPRPISMSMSLGSSSLK